jgi:hypothetical protein
VNWKTDQLKRESTKESLYYNLSLDTIGWFIDNYHTDKILQDILYNLAKKIYLSENREYIKKLHLLPEKYEVPEKIEEFENMFLAIERRKNK